MMKAKPFGLLLTLSLIFAAMTGCGSQKTASESSDAVVDEMFDSEPVGFELNGTSDAGTAGAMSTVYFAFDSSALTSATKERLKKNAAFLKENDGVEIQVEGHCDERGGIQYNIALGERRARAVRDYLAALGISTNRMSIISYGKERPKAYGHNEEAWSQNRRSNFVITAK